MNFILNCLVFESNLNNSKNCFWIRNRFLLVRVFLLIDCISRLMSSVIDISIKHIPNRKIPKPLPTNKKATPRIYCMTMATVNPTGFFQLKGNLCQVWKTINIWINFEILKIWVDLIYHIMYGNSKVSSPKPVLK